jgi:phosphoribosylaminoimidazolecarboxamide formyltransferase / IMP cyclohydrolase
MIRVRRALLSASDKTGLVEFAQGLARLGVDLLSTGGTAHVLRAAGLPVTDVADVTGVPEMLDGRVKTLHPAIHGGVLAVRGNADHARQLAAQGIAPIDLVAVNLYPFEETLANPDRTVADVIEQIDIGGPALLRSAAKNFAGVAVLADPGDYSAVLAELRDTGGSLSAATRARLARKAFAHTARYDAAIAGFYERLAGDDRPPDSPASLPSLDAPLSALGSRLAFPALLHIRLQKIQELRYGENPHQRAAFYRDLALQGGLAAARQFQGKALSYNNLLDLHSAWELAREFPEPVAAIVKHNNPCGVATAATLCDAYCRARDADPVSAFGAIIALNRPLDGATAQAIAATFVEAVIAPGYSDDARRALADKKNLRLLEWPPEGGGPTAADGGFEVRRVSGGMLVQDRDAARVEPTALTTVTRRPPTVAEMQALRFAWTVVKHVKSNAIVLAGAQATVGIGAGQMSRVDAVKLALTKAATVTQGTVLASDAFFPFRDGVDVAAAAGVTAIIQPGGSVRDAEAIAAADEHDLAMVFTGVRHFRH